MTKEAFRTEFWKLAAAAPRVVVTAHVSPDDDSIGSVLSLREIILQKLPQKEVRILYTGELIDRWQPIAGFEAVEFVPDLGTQLRSDDLLAVCDVNTYARVAKDTDAIASLAVKVCIDHHVSAPDAWTLAQIDSGFSSNCEHIYSIFKDDTTLTPALAEPLLLGILGDTGNFAFVNPGQSEVFLVAKELVDALGVSIDQFRSRYGGIPQHIFPLLQLLYTRTTFSRIAGWPDVQYAYIDTDALRDEKYSDEDISAASHIYIGQFLTRVHGYAWGFVVSPRSDGTCRVSSRSLPGSVNVRALHEALGIGGGHDRASGGKFENPDPKACIDIMLEWMKNNAPVLG